MSNNSETIPPIYLGGKSEFELASYQQFQIGNTCALHCISAAIQILTGRIIHPSELAEELDALPFFTRLPYRCLKDGPVSPIQQVALIRRLAKELKVPLSARLAQPQRYELITQIGRPDTVTLVTIGWMKRNAPAITLGDGNVSFTPDNFITWHTIIAAAYDPIHKNNSGQLKPWGFINSWVNQGDHLFWISNPDFIRSWSFITPCGGSRSTVIITLLS